MSRFIAIDRDTAYLLPPSVSEWLPENQLARFVVEVVDQMDLSELVRQYAGRGCAAYHPARSEEHTSELQSPTTLFPYTTLFRSNQQAQQHRRVIRGAAAARVLPHQLAQVHLIDDLHDKEIGRAHV